MIGSRPAKRKELEREIARITEEMSRRNKELNDSNNTLSLLRTIDALVLESHTSLKVVCEHITEAITQATHYPLVALFTRSSRTKDILTLYGWSGKDWLGGDLPTGLSHPLHLQPSAEWLQQPANSQLVSLEDLSASDIASFLGCSEAEVNRLNNKLPLKSLYVVKLLIRRRLVGLLVVGYASSITKLAESDTLLTDRLAETIGVALNNKLLFEENQHVLRELKESNAKLKALDEAKDEFISMASHQLRTPLTSIKGYISMVLEGDAGKITPTQKKLLTQSFFSSQRMVYLIADLLNVSRLRAGKFMVEKTLVNLASVVQEEMIQLQETAASRSLKLTYKKPKHFPDLMLDETKTRQLIMNFTDNAIYYTPAGGHIVVRLLETPTTVEFSVEDNGIGVPRSEQRHLFTKFYRAGNARQARPDGTGLGLFMAKKIITAQGGSLIFESREGKGSTFGFSFSKKMLLAVKQNKSDTSPIPKNAKTPV